MICKQLQSPSFNQIATSVAMMICMSLPCLAQEFAGQRFAGQQGNIQATTAHRPRMRVVEYQAQTSPADAAPVAKSIITIVGAVKRSGVYETSGLTVCLKDLIEAAGGMTEKASPSIRIIRGGYLRTQLYYSEQCTDDLKPGDIVVVVSQPAAFSDEVVKSDLIPVVCVGLDTRPIVLPLEPSIATVRHLSQRLLQTQELADSAIVLDPLGRRLQSTLVPGSIVFFKTDQLDLAALDQVKQKQPFPAMLPMTPPKPQAETELEAVIPPVSAMLQVHNFPAPEMKGNSQQHHAEVLPPVHAGVGHLSVSTDQPEVAPTPIFNAPISVLTVDSPQEQMQTAQITVEASSQNFQSQTEQLQLPVMPTFQQQSVAENTTSSLTIVSEEPSGNQSISYQTHSSNIENHQPEPTLAEAEPVENMTPATANAETEQSFGKSEQSAEVVNAPLPPYEEKPVDNFSSKAFSLTALEAQAASPDHASQSWIPVAIGVGLLAALCLGASLLWSRYDYQQTRRMFEAQHTRQTSESSSQTPKTELEAILDHSIPMIEEQVLIPENIALHGEAVGHRRMILHEKHMQMQGPHFARKPDEQQNKPVVSASRYDERELRKTLKAAFSIKTTVSIPSDADIETDFAAVDSQSFSRPSVPVQAATVNMEDLDDRRFESIYQAPSQRPVDRHDRVVRSDAGQNDIERYDIVQPESHKVDSVGPLERALNAISKEKTSKEIH